MPPPAGASSLDFQPPELRGTTFSRRGRRVTATRVHPDDQSFKTINGVFINRRVPPPAGAAHLPSPVLAARLCPPSQGFTARDSRVPAAQTTAGRRHPQAHRTEADTGRGPMWGLPER